MSRAPRIVVVDDSVISRGVIVDGLRAAGLDVVAVARDGAEAIRCVQTHRPDAVTCDLQMPGMDGFTFLRIITQKAPVPVIVVSSDSNPDSALLALEIGARDFVVKPNTTRDGLESMVGNLVSKLVAVTDAAETMQFDSSTEETKEFDHPIPKLITIGASTGGPAAVRTLLGRLGGPPKVPVLIALHMPAGFTKTFAARVAKRTNLDIREAEDGVPLTPGVVWLSPGDRHLCVEMNGGILSTRLDEPTGRDIHCPSVDRLFASAADAVGADLLAIVLTGMGKDGSIGAPKVKGAGGTVWAESPSTAVIPGMPNSADTACGGLPRYPIDKLAVLLDQATCQSPSD